MGFIGGIRYLAEEGEVLGSPVHTAETRVKLDTEIPQHSKCDSFMPEVSLSVPQCLFPHLSQGKAPMASDRKYPVNKDASGQCYRTVRGGQPTKDSRPRRERRSRASRRG